MRMKLDIVEDENACRENQQHRANVAAASPSLHPKKFGSPISTALECALVAPVGSFGTNLSVAVALGVRSTTSATTALGVVRTTASVATTLGGRTTDSATTTNKVKTCEGK